MRGLIQQKYSFTMSDLSRHVSTRIGNGKIVIVVERPSGFLSSFTKHWRRLILRTKNQYASTLRPERMQELGGVITHMQGIRFTTKWPQDTQLADVYITTPEKALAWAPECSTLYVTCEVKREHLYIMSSWMQTDGLVAICRLTNVRTPKLQP